MVKKDIHIIQIGKPYFHKVHENYSIMVTEIEGNFCTVKRLHDPEAPLVKGIAKYAIYNNYYQKEDSPMKL